MADDLYENPSHLQVTQSSPTTALAPTTGDTSYNSSVYLMSLVDKQMEQLTEKDKIIQTKDEEIKNKNAIIAQKDEEIARLKSRNIKLEMAASTSRAVWNEILPSTSKGTSKDAGKADDGKNKPDVTVKKDEPKKKSDPEAKKKGQK
ncbi:unnamed protein product [Meloidogyne enterolobii]|uniref:Uncharacterized protein n=1 Tax=Meloidogyne enterolobii TaxID=390850 RepID=A0ACB0ZNZ7_MELEN